MFWEQEWAHPSIEMLQDWYLTGTFHCHRNGTEDQAHPLSLPCPGEGFSSVLVEAFACPSFALPAREADQRVSTASGCHVKSVFLLDVRQQIVP